MPKSLIVILLPLLLAGCWPEASGLSEESQRAKQFYQCQLDAMNHHQPEVDYILSCMGAAGYKLERGQDCQSNLLYPFCFVRMK
jgi:hypothetical protein